MYFRSRRFFSCCAAEFFIIFWTWEESENKEKHGVKKKKKTKDTLTQSNRSHFRHAWTKQRSHKVSNVLRNCLKMLFTSEAISDQGATRSFWPCCLFSFFLKRKNREFRTVNFRLCWRIGLKWKLRRNHAEIIIGNFWVKNRLELL